MTGEVRLRFSTGNHFVYEHLALSGGVSGCYSSGLEYSPVHIFQGPVSPSSAWQELSRSNFWLNWD